MKRLGEVEERSRCEAPADNGSLLQHGLQGCYTLQHDLFAETLLSFAVVIPGQLYLSRLRLASKLAVSKIAVDSESSQRCAQKQQAHNTKIAAASSLWTFVYAACKLSLKGVFTGCQIGYLGVRQHEQQQRQHQQERQQRRQQRRQQSRQQQGQPQGQHQQAEEKVIRKGHQKRALKLDIRKAHPKRAAAAAARQAVTRATARAATRAAARATE